MPTINSEYQLAIDYEQSFINFSSFKEEIKVQLNNVQKWEHQINNSTKNFVLADEDDEEYRYLELKKESDNVFELTIQHPLSPLQAMAIAMTRFDAQLKWFDSLKLLSTFVAIVISIDNRLQMEKGKTLALSNSLENLLFPPGRYTIAQLLNLTPYFNTGLKLTLQRHKELMKQLFDMDDEKMWWVVKGEYGDVDAKVLLLVLMLQLMSR